MRHFMLTGSPAYLKFVLMYGEIWGIKIFVGTKAFKKLQILKFNMAVKN